MDWLFRVFRRRKRPGVPEAERLAREAGEAPSVPAGLLIAERITAFPRFAQHHPLQACYLMALINLTARASLAEAEEITRRLELVADYHRGPGPQQHHAQALGSAALATRAAGEGLALARLMRRLSAFSSDASIQELHARVLGTLAGRSQPPPPPAELAAELEQLPAFHRSEGIQVEYARLLERAATDQEALARTEIANTLAALPGFAGSPTLQATHARLVQEQASPSLPPAVERGRVWTILASVEDPGGRPVVFQDQAEAVRLHLLAHSQQDATEQALAMYCEMLRNGGHRISDDHVVDGLHRIKLMCID